jgi:hypothetical protein
VNPYFAYQPYAEMGRSALAGLKVSNYDPSRYAGCRGRPEIAFEAQKVLFVEVRNFYPARGQRNHPNGPI